MNFPNCVVAIQIQNSKKTGTKNRQTNWFQRKTWKIPSRNKLQLLLSFVENLQNWWSVNDIIALSKIAICEAPTKSTVKNLPVALLVRTSASVLRNSCNYHSHGTCRIHCRFSSDYRSFIPADYVMDVVWTEFPNRWNYVDRLTLRKGFHFLRFNLVDWNRFKF